MGLVSRDDGWRVPDSLWEWIAPLLPRPPFHPLGCHRPRVPNRDGRGVVGVADGDAAERVGRNRDLFELVGASALSGVGAGPGVRRDLAPRAARIRLGRGHRLGVAGRRRRQSRSGAGPRRSFARPRSCTSTRSAWVAGRIRRLVSRVTCASPRWCASRSLIASRSNASWRPGFRRPQGASAGPRDPSAAPCRACRYRAGRP